MDDIINSQFLPIGTAIAGYIGYQLYTQQVTPDEEFDQMTAFKIAAGVGAVTFAAQQCQNMAAPDDKVLTEPFHGGNEG
jgi:hypothetical protein